MPKNIRSNVELGINIVIAVSIVVVAVLIVKRYAFEPVNRESVPLITKGERLNAANVDWKGNKKTLVFFLAKDCVYCNSSAPFHRQLIEEASKRDVKLLAILPNPVEEGRQYINSLSLPIDNVQTGSLSTYKIPGTPSVLFVDDQGFVRSVWMGAVPGQEQAMRDELVALFDAKAADDASAK